MKRKITSSILVCTLVSSLVGNTSTSAANNLIKSCTKPGKNKDQVKTETRPAMKNDLNRCILATQQEQYLSFIMRNIDLFSSSLKKIFKKYNDEKIELKNNKSKKNILAMKSILALAISGVIPAGTLIAYKKGFFSKNQKNEKNNEETNKEIKDKETENEKSKTQDQELEREYENSEKTIKDLEQQLKSNQTDKKIYLISTVVLAILLVGGGIFVYLYINKLKKEIKDIDDLEGTKNNLKQEIYNNLESEVIKLEKKKLNLENSINDLNNKKINLEKQINDMEKEIEDNIGNNLKDKVNKLKNEKVGLENNFNKLKVEYDTLQKNCLGLMIRKENLNKLIKEKELKVKGLETGFEVKKNLINNFKEKMEESNKIKEESDKRIEEDNMIIFKNSYGFSGQ